MKKISIVMGSDSDYETMKYCCATLEAFDIEYDIEIISAHRCPDFMHSYAKSASRKGFEVIICAAGGAAHLAGVMASMTPLPVIGVPMNTDMGGLDSLYSTVQMPSGVPVATMGVGVSGAKNAAILAVQILGVADTKLKDMIVTYKSKLQSRIDTKNMKFKEKHRNG